MKRSVLYILSICFFQFTPNTIKGNIPQPAFYCNKLASYKALQLIKQENSIPQENFFAVKANAPICYEMQGQNGRLTSGIHENVTKKNNSVTNSFYSTKYFYSNPFQPNRDKNLSLILSYGLKIPP